MIKRIKEKFIQLLHENTTPSEIALGVAIGVFVVILPIYGFHTIIVIGLALLIPRANKIALLAGTNVSLPPTLPIITWGGYEIGRAVFKGSYPPLTTDYFKNFKWEKFGDFYYPLFIGSLILAVILAAVFYILTFVVISWIKRRKTHATP